MGEKGLNGTTKKGVAGRKRADRRRAIIVDAVLYNRAFGFLSHSSRHRRCVCVSLAVSLLKATLLTGSVSSDY